MTGHGMEMSVSLLLLAFGHGGVMRHFASLLEILEMN